WDQLADEPQHVTPEALGERVGQGTSPEAVSLAVANLQRSGALERGDDVVVQARIFVPADAAADLARLEAAAPDLVARGHKVLVAAEVLGEEGYAPDRWAQASGLDPDVLQDTLFELHRHDVVGFSPWLFA